MFGFLKKKLKDAIGSFSKEVEDSSEIIEDERIKEEVKIEKKPAEDKKEELKKDDKVAQEKDEDKVSKVRDDEEKKEDILKKDDTIKEEVKKVKSKDKKEEAEIEKKPEEKSEEKSKETSKELIKDKKEEIVEKKDHEDLEKEIKEDKTSEVKEAGKRTEKATEKPVRKSINETEDEKEEDTDDEKKENTEDKKEQETEDGKEKKNEKVSEKKGFFSKLKDRFSGSKEIDEVDKEDLIDDKVIDEEKEEIIYEKKDDEELDKDDEKVEDIEKKSESGFFGRISQGIVDAVAKKSLSESKFNDLFFELEIAMLENNVAIEVIEKIRDDLKKELVDTKQIRGRASDIISSTLNKSISELFVDSDFNLISKINEKKPYVIVFVGVNGSGKTTTIAKVAQLLKKNNLSCVMAAADTFRAAAIQQLEEHANNLDVKLIKHDYNADPAAVAFDAIKYANSRNIDCVLIDTAGRLHSNTNLMDELKKVIRVSKPDLKLFIGESITGNDCIEQAQKFNETVNLDGIILSKADVDDKGGAAISVSYVTKKPILYLGVGQGYDDLIEFDSKLIVEKIGL
ncbi:MAG: signal recognition particle-docking protein FtsY [Candidatus Woesearchaeota archaeon]